MQVPLLDLKSQYAKIKKDVLAAIGDVLDSQVCIGGPKVAELEKQIAAISDCKFAIGVSSGTDALLVSLMSLDIGSGDEVITTPFTFFATAGCIARLGAKPVFVDIDAKTCNINPSLIEKAITKRTKAIIPVHLYGQMADMDPITGIAKRHNLFVIEDAAQSISSTYKGRKAGSIGTCGAFSFYPTKNLSGIGDGGMVVTNNEKLAVKMKVMRDHGQNPTYYYNFVGGNFRLDAVQAAAILVKLPYLDKWSQARRKNAEYYNKRFADTAVQTPYVRSDCVTVYHLYVIRVSDRDKLMEHLRGNNIGCGIYYPMPLHLQKCFEYLGYKKGDFPESEKAANEVLALPIYPELTDEMKDCVVKAVLEALK
jgi:dTDP-4-amino-4,6-dideoxygalactose transaminase